MDKEQVIINKFSNNFIGDDGAVVGNLVYSKDMFCEDSHFKMSWLSPYEIGFKAMLVNLSDAYAMNSLPKYALLGLGVPKNMQKNELNELCLGLNEAANKHNVTIIGGDTISSDKLIISLTIISSINSKPLLRSGAKIGNLVCFTGKLGDSLRGLRSLQNGRNLGKNHRFVRPELRVKFIQKAAKFIKSAMDISDGLASDLPKICQNYGVKFHKKFSKFELISGEEYEILFTISPKNLAKIKNLGKKSKTKINILGKIVRGRIKIYGKFSHF